MKIQSLFLVLYFGIGLQYSVQSQDSLSSTGLFEGKVVYQLQLLNPQKALISDEDFYNSIPNRGRSEVTLYLRGNKYRYEYPDHIEIFNPSIGQIYSQSLDTKDSGGYVPIHPMDDSVIQTTNASPETILGYSCSGVLIRAKWESKTFYFNPSQLKTQSSFWRNHNRDYWSYYFRKSANFPLLIVRKSNLGNYEMRVVKVESKKLDDSLFQTPNL